MHTLVFSQGFLLADRPLFENEMPIEPVIKLPRPEDECFYTYHCETIRAVAGVLDADSNRRLEEAAFSDTNFERILREVVQTEAARTYTPEKPGYFIIVTDVAAYLFSIIQDDFKCRRFNHEETFAVGPNDKKLLPSVKRELHMDWMRKCTIPEALSLAISAYTPEITRLQYVDINPPLLESPKLEELDFSSEASAFYPPRYRREMKAFLEKLQ